jgi:hypothetical protein
MAQVANPLEVTHKPAGVPSVYSGLKYERHSFKGYLQGLGRDLGTTDVFCAFKSIKFAHLQCSETSPHTKCCFGALFRHLNPGQDQGHGHSIEGSLCRNLWNRIQCWSNLGSAAMFLKITILRDTDTVQRVREERPGPWSFQTQPGGKASQEAQRKADLFLSVDLIHLSLPVPMQHVNCKGNGAHGALTRAWAVPPWKFQQQQSLIQPYKPQKGGQSPPRRSPSHLHLLCCSPTSVFLIKMLHLHRVHLDHLK